ncbi:hypothetical protein GAYE_FCTG49G0059 [Galdieria yellowstonensis]|uniref:Uncharacterized protein n=1 Tax=Galdieria yellowstonensis TaxID=3028027 RepID=A0AAV9I638_9RHOD|nr:hypothetical protein GAYE_FCTG49G0059 [Galdieria yellowstonensis]
MNSSGEYSLFLHIGAVFLLFVFSLLGIGLPLHRKVSSTLTHCPNILLLARAFGTGIVLATGFIHLLGHAYEHIAYVGLKGLTFVVVGLAALGGAIFVQFVEFLATRSIKDRNRGVKENSIEESRPISQQTTTSKHSDMSSSASSNSTSDALNYEAAKGHVTYVPVGGELSLAENEATSFTESRESGSHLKDVLEHCHSRSNHSHAAYIDHVLIHFTHFSNRHVVIIILEFGIAFHSFMIGTGLGVVEDKEFATFFLTLSLHQFFEGLALGSVILQDLSILSCRFVFISVAIFSTMTPLGTLFGILLESLGISFFSSNLFRGLADAISAGVLIYTGLVELLTYQFTSNLEFRESRLSIVFLAYAFLLLGISVVVMISFQNAD